MAANPPQNSRGRPSVVSPANTSAAQAAGSTSPGVDIAQTLITSTATSTVAGASPRPRRLAGTWS